MRATFVIDYQNLHLTARDLFCSDRDAHEALIEPMAFARVALQVRNQGQRPGYPHVQLGRVLVYRGLPHVDHQSDQHRRCQLQAELWRRARAEVHLRDLKYRPRYAAGGSVVRDINGRVEMDPRSGREKGIDVLCALACVREARASDTDLVILA